MPRRRRRWLFWVSAPARQAAGPVATGNVRVAGANERSDGRRIAADDDDRRTDGGKKILPGENRKDSPPISPLRGQVTEGKGRDFTRISIFDFFRKRSWL